jgi:site-specific DNA-methyltransferase (adenine-specific)
VIDLRCGDSVRLLAEDPALRLVDAVVTDPPYGMRWRTDSKRYSGGRSSKSCRLKQHQRGLNLGRSDWGPVLNDDRPFDPSPWLDFKRVILWGSNHFAARLHVGSTLVWIKRADRHFGTFLSDAEIGWMKGGHGVYCYRQRYGNGSLRKEGGGQKLHPNQKPIGLFRWCYSRLKLKPGMTVLDPYMGSGSAGVASLEMGLRYIGVDIDPANVEIARRRLASITPSLALA